MKFWNRRNTGKIAAVLLASSLLASGCASSRERMEKQEAYRTIGIHAMEDGDYASAMEAFDSALIQAKGFGQNEMDICFYKAAAQFAAGNLSGAIETYDVLLDSDKKNSDAYFLRGCVYLKSGESKKALEDFDASVKYAAEDEIYLQVYGSLNSAGYGEEAASYLEEALKKKRGKKDDNDAVKGRIYLIKEQYQDAAEHLEKAVEKGNVEANLFLAQAYEALGDTKKKESCIDAYVEEYSESSVAYCQLGRRAMEQGEYENAVTYLKQGLALEEVTNEQELMSNLIAAYEYCADFQSAAELMQQYIAKYPDDAEAQREHLFLNKNRGEEKQTDD